MNDEKDLGRELLAQDEKSEPEMLRMPEGLARRIRQAKRTVWILATLTVVLWSCVAAGVVGYCWCFMTYVFPLVKWMATTTAESRAELSGLIWREFQYTGRATMIGTYVWAVLVVMAAVCTVLFILASRRATLRQIHGSLAEISQQLRRLAEK